MTASDTLKVSFSELARKEVLVFGDGYRTKREELGLPGLPIMRVAQVADGYVLHDSVSDHVRNEYLGRIGSKVSKLGDVVLTTKGTFGRRARITSVDEGYVYSPQVCFFRVLDPTHLSADYLYHWLGSPEFANQAHGMKAQTDMADYLSLRDLASIHLTLPTIRIQRALVDALRPLEDKIHLNYLQSQTLRQLRDTLLPKLLSGELRVPAVAEPLV